MKSNTYAFVQDGKRHVWDVPRLWALSADFPVFEFPIAAFSAMDLDIWFCGVNVPTVRAVYEHSLRIDAAELRYPILLDPDGTVLDGVHRLLKAHKLGHSTVSAVRFAQMPPPDRIEDWPPDPKLAFLRAHNADHVAHGASVLLEHLVGVQTLLQSWGAAPALADAGLFHAVYGTESFGQGVLPVSLREAVRAVIGPEAEALAYLFGAMEKESFEASVARGATPRVRDRHSGAVNTLDAATWRALCELVVANWMEQHPRVPEQFKQHKAEMFQALLPWLSPGAAASLRSAYGFGAGAPGGAA